MKTIFALLFSFTIANCFGQITLEHTYNNGYPTIIHLSISGDKYYILDSGTIYIYNLDHSLWKQIDSKIPTGANGTVSNISENLFNTDGNIAFWQQYSLVQSGVTTYVGNVLDENGNSLFNLPGCITANVENTSAGPKLITAVLGSPPSYSVYSLPGKLVVEGIKPVTGGGSNISARAFPNPSGGQVNITSNIPYDESRATLNIYNNEGQKISSQIIPIGNSTNSIDASMLSKGIYQYKIVTDSGSHTEGSFTIQ